ncbi:GerAB/ArcD/ProY family transporter [Priestia megaterium]|uniref:GerAB/ArcD/ProY family transporter n=1 Tax=Priestia megaterium TaxID=1404 RepID=UPI003D02C4B0
MMVTLILLGILVLSPYYSQITMFPSYELGRRIDVGNFLQGIEVVIAILWFITLFFKLCIYFYATLLGFANVFHIKDYKLFSFPVALIMITLSLIVYPSVSYQKDWDTKTWIPYSLLVGILYPLFLLIAGFIQNKKRRSSNG